MSGHDSAHQPVDVLRKGLLVGVLVATLLGLHQFGVPNEGFEARGLLALGFVILAAYAIGELAEVIRLPHITGYLLAGLALGPSTAALLSAALPEGFLPPPLNEGVVNREVIEQLGLLDSLALALIALTAGGELKLEELKRGLRHIVGVLTGHAVTVGVGVVGFLYLAMSVAPQLLPPVAALSGVGILALGAVVAAISFATSPAATIAVVNSTQAKGPVSSTVLSAVVLKDAIVVIAFSAATAIATSALGLSTGGGFLLALWHIAQSILLGAMLGGIIHLYLRFIGAELLLALVGMIYTTTFVAEQIHAEAALVFIVAGVVVSNFSDRGETLIEEVERLSLPVYVVFFTLAGAKLHLDELWGMLPLAVGLVVVRMLALFVGVRAGAQLSGAPPTVARYGWMGFVSQAGLAITLATQVKQTYPDGVGEALFSLILGGVALNEMFGPVALQWALGLAGETGGGQPKAPQAPPAARQVVREPVDEQRPFGEPLDSGDPALDTLLKELSADLSALIRERTWAPLADLRRDSEAWVRQLRREFLRVHRHTLVQCDNAESGAALAEALRNDVGELGDRWRDLVLNLAAEAPRTERWSPMELVEAIDQHVQSLPFHLNAPFSPASLAQRPEGPTRRARRALLRARSRMGAQREIKLRDLARYHLSGVLPARLEGVAALLTDADLHTARRTQELFEAIALSWEAVALAAEEEASRKELRARLLNVRSEANEDFSCLETELESLCHDGVTRSMAIVGARVQRLKEDLHLIGTFELPHWHRRFGAVFAVRNQGVTALTHGLADARHTVTARYSQLALELELVGLEGRVKNAVHTHGHQLSRLVQGRGPRQLQRVEADLNDWLRRNTELLETGATAAALKEALRADTQPLVHRLHDARSAIAKLQGELSDETWLSPLLEDLHRHARDLTEHYTVPRERPMIGDWALPSAVATTDIPFRNVVAAFIETSVSRDLVDLTAQLAHKVLEMANALDEVERVVNFNVDLAVAELDMVDDDAPITEATRELVRAMVAGALGRSHTRLQRLVDTANEEADSAEQRVHAIVIGEFEALHGRILDGDLIDVHGGLLRESAFGQQIVERAGAWKGLFPSLVTRTQSLALRVLGAERLEAARLLTGLPRPRGQQDLREALRPPIAQTEVPVVYRRLFSEQALEGVDVLSGRKDALNRIRRLISGEGSGLPTMAVVSLDTQSARALVNTALRAHSGPTYHYEPEEPATAASVQAWLSELPASGAVITINNFSMLFTRQPGGMAPLQALVSAMLTSHNAWVMTVDESVWSYVVDATAIRDAVGEVILLPHMSAQELEQAVIARHTMSGYDLLFDAGDDLGWQLYQLTLRRENREMRERTAWFRTLHEASNGVLADALRLWMAAIVTVDDEQDRLALGPVPRPPISRLRDLPEDTLLTLRETTRQGWISPTQHASLFRTPRPHAEAHLAQLHHLGLLHEQQGRYRIASHLRGPIQRALAIRGWV